MSGPKPEPLELPSDMRLDPNVEQTNHMLWVITDEGLRTAWNGATMKCPVCQGRLEDMPDCNECAGRGVVDHVPFADHPWDEIAPNLFLGGHDCQISGAPPYGEVVITEEDGFELVVSLHYRWGNSPPLFTEHHTHRMADAELDPEHHTAIDDLAEIVHKSILNGRKTLVRCQAGLNRSALVVGLVLLRMGMSADEAITVMRQKRSPYVLCNASFVRYIQEKEKTQ